MATQSIFQYVLSFAHDLAWLKDFYIFHGLFYTHTKIARNVGALSTTRISFKTVHVFYYRRRSQVYRCLKSAFFAGSAWKSNCRKKFPGSGTAGKNDHDFGVALQGILRLTGHYKISQVSSCLYTADGSIEDSPLVGLSDSWFSRKIEVNWARKYLYWALLLFGCIFARVFQTRYFRPSRGLG